MDSFLQTSLVKGSLVAEHYTILLLMKQGNNAQTYRVRNSNGKLCCLKLLDVSKIHQSGINQKGRLLEIELVKSTSHVNILRYIDSGETIINGRKYHFLVTDFIIGETLAEGIVRGNEYTLYDIKLISNGVLASLQYLHSLPNPIIHNQITADNLMIDTSGNIPEVILIDFGYARTYHQSTDTFYREELDFNYVASECFNNLFSPQSDLFSVGVIIYQLIYGRLPWPVSILSNFNQDEGKLIKMFLIGRKNKMDFSSHCSAVFDYDESIEPILSKALSSNLEIRFKSGLEFSNALNGDFQVETDTTDFNEDDLIDTRDKESNTGFSLVAGMQKLKDQLQNDVLDLIKNPDEYRRHHLSLPNGMLLYGPPGCGKTFFAERFAEEAGYIFIKVVSSDIASIYIHGAQEKIGKLFKSAKEQAPSILYFDELDAMVPNRDKTNSQSQSGEVNEFLSQLDNIGQFGVFVIGSTNKPESIDKAILRAGRLEKWFYIPPPDLDARMALFELYLKDRPLDFGIDYTLLGEMTLNYVSSDIKFLVDEASRKTIRDKEKRITMDILRYVINHQKPTVSLDELSLYENIRREIEQDFPSYI